MGLQVTESMTSLTMALELSLSLQADMRALADWAESVELELDQVEATPHTDRDIQAEISFVKVADWEFVGSLYTYPYTLYLYISIEPKALTLPRK